MFLDRFILERRLVKRNDSTGRRWVPLRAYGKLEIATEYVDVACADVAAGRQFRTWIREGTKCLEGVCAPRPPHICPHRLLISTNHGRVWAVACIWHSSDKRGEQGTRRHFPFSLFVLVPAPPRKRALSVAAALCAPLWSAMEGIYPQLVAAPDRAACIQRIRQQGLHLVPDDQIPVVELALSAGRIPLADWLRGVLGVPSSWEALLARLQGLLEESWRTRGRQPGVWRMPLTTNAETLVQVAVWLHWLEANLGRYPAELNLLVPAGDASQQRDFGVVLRRVLVEDFAGLSAEPELVDRMMGTRLWAGRSASRAERMVRELVADLSADQRTLADFAKWAFPRPVRAWA